MNSQRPGRVQDKKPYIYVSGPILAIVSQKIFGLVLVFTVS